LPADHPDKSKEIGSEPTPAAFVDVLLAVTAELRRVLAPHGSIAVELGDTYAGSGESGWERDKGEYRSENRSRASAEGLLQQTRDISKGWPQAKSKALIPELYRIALAYGINPLTGQPSPAGQWRVRNVVTWCRANPPVGALGDKWRPATSDVVVACTSSKRYWDDLATRQPHMHPNATHTVGNVADTRGDYGDPTKRIENSPHGAPLLDWWSITAGGFKGAHYAVFPQALVEPLVKAMAPPRVCRTCGEPSRRITKTEYEPSFDGGGSGHTDDGSGLPGGTRRIPERMHRVAETLGFTDCGHDNYRPALVLDPFAGSGTTLSVATGHGHDAIGFDLDPRNADLALDRVGPLLLEVQS
jgi:hypothetical protein